MSPVSYRQRRAQYRCCKQCLLLYTNTVTDAEGYLVAQPCGHRLRKAPRPKTLPKDLEAPLLKDVKDFARRQGWRTYHTLRSEGSDPGYPDLILAHEQMDRLVVAELKSATGTPTPAQRWWLDFYARWGAETYLWRPKHRDAILVCLRLGGHSVPEGRWLE